MDFFLPLFMDCDPDNCDAVVCLDEDEKRASREAHLRRQDGLPSKYRKGSKPQKALHRYDEYATDDETGRSTRSDFPWRYSDDGSVTSYYPPRRQQNGSVVESGTGRTIPTTGTQSFSDASENSSWSESSRGTRHTKQWSPSSRETRETMQTRQWSPSSRETPETMQESSAFNSSAFTSAFNSSAFNTQETPNYGKHTRTTVFSRATYGIVEEPENCNDDDSVGAVRMASKDKLQSTHEQQTAVGSSSNYAFDYIRKASRKFANPALDPPSDKSVGTSRSIRAEDAGSVLLRKGIIQPKNNELARVILKRRKRDSRKLGPEP